MSTNVFFSPKVRSEQYLYEDLIIESIKMMGQDVYYLPRDIVTLDEIFGEDIESNFSESYIIEAYPENIEGFGGAGDLMSKFGLDIKDEATLIVAKRSWDKCVGRWNTDQSRPLEGDLIYFPLSKSLFEISYIEHEKPFYQLSNLPVYQLQVRLFEHNGQDFDTGIDDIDSFNALGYSIEFMVDNKPNIGDIVKQDKNNGAFVTGRVIKIEEDISRWKMWLADIESSDSTIRAFELGGIYSDVYVGQILILPSIEDKALDQFADNDVFEKEGNSFIDFSESNPFGDPNDV